MKKQNRIKLCVSLIFAGLICIYLFSLWLFNDFVLSEVKSILTFFTWFFGLTLGPMTPGILYTGGKGYSKIFGNNLFTTKEKGFVFFFLDLVVGAFIILISIFFINWFLPLVLEYVILIFFLWILLFYLWFNRYKEYNFPHYYFWSTLIILLIGGLIIYFYI